MKKYVIGFLIGILCSSTAVYAATKIMATDVAYSHGNSSVKNVSEAIDELTNEVNALKLEGNRETLNSAALNTAGSTTYTVSGHKYYIAQFISNSGAANNITYSCQNAVVCLQLPEVSKSYNSRYAAGYLAYVIPESTDSEVTITLTTTASSAYEGSYVLHGID